jgi:hypothetical protein
MCGPAAQGLPVAKGGATLRCKLPNKYANRKLHVLLAVAAFNDASRAKTVQSLFRALSTKPKCNSTGDSNDN